MTPVGGPSDRELAAACAIVIACNAEQLVSLLTAVYAQLFSITRDPAKMRANVIALLDKVASAAPAPAVRP